MKVVEEAKVEIKKKKPETNPKTTKLPTNRRAQASDAKVNVCYHSQRCSLVLSLWAHYLERTSPSFILLGIIVYGLEYPFVLAPTFLPPSAYPLWGKVRNREGLHAVLHVQQ